MLEQLILDLSLSKDLYKALQEWELIQMCRSSITEDCICGRKIKCVYEYGNLRNGNSIILGSGCRNIFNRLLKLCKKRKKQVCLNCGKLYIIENGNYSCNNCKSDSDKEYELMMMEMEKM